MREVAGAAVKTGAGTQAGSQRVAIGTGGELAAIKTAVEKIDNTVVTLGDTTYAQTSDNALSIGAVRNDVLAALGTADADWVPLQVNAAGALYTEVSSALPAGTNNIGKIEILASPVLTNATGTSAIATSYAPSADFYLDSVTLHLSAAGTTAENFTVTLNANDGSAYDTVLVKQDLSVGSTVDLVYVPEDGPMLFESGDAIDVAWANTESRTYGLRIMARLA